MRKLGCRFSQGREAELSSLAASIFLAFHSSLILHFPLLLMFYSVLMSRSTR